ncbi:protein translocase subunit SecD [Desertimonas flava]|uniref:protein translocase subunit SecD n=1 Tax=Desertimonas flava TaxID=2064846 RepID=UPI000E34F957|nr:protein translocase subunit SecD [Desertimonas flava]
MIQRRLWISLGGIVLVAAVLLGINLGVGNEPALGLDLQGGVSVVLAPTEEATHDDLLTIRDLIRDELEDRGIAEPEVRVEGDNVVVDLPGIKDQRDALAAVDVAGIVTLRPVVSPCVAPTDEAAADSSVPDSSVPDSGAPESSAPGSSTPADESTPAASDSPASTTDATASTVPATSDPAATTDGPAGMRRPAAAGTSTPPSSEPTDAATDDTATDDTATDDTATDDTATDDTTVDSSVAESTTTTTEPPLGPIGPGDFGTPPASPFTPLPPTDEDSSVVLPDVDGNECTVGPVQRGPNGELTGFLFERDSAKATLNGGAWQVDVGLSPVGSSVFNSLASTCLSGDQSCPYGLIAIVMDGVVQSAPQVQTANFSEGVSITGNFSEGEARSLARVLNRGAFPIDVRAENVQTVSATLGRDSLNASIFAALAGVVLVLLLLAFFYRRLIVVVLAGIAVWAMLIYSVAAFVSQTTNYALTLAGVAGIVVSIGVTVDSYVVYFERIKDEVRHGRTIKNSAQRSFKSTWRTILAADLVSIIAAVVLFILSVGSVRGFALYLGITTVCDVIVFYFFTRPSVVLLAANGWLDRGDTFGLKEYE